MKLTYNDRQHAYWLDGHRCKSVTTVAKIPDDTYALDQWRKRMVVTGMAMSPPLVERAAAHFDERDKLDEIAEEALVVARSHEAAARGTAAHRITERIDLGLQVIDTELSRQVEAAWTKALDDAGLDVVPELVERIVVYPQRFIAGRFDRICRRRSDQHGVIVDLKTGDNAVRYPHSISVQLAMYANAPAMAGPIPPAGGTTTHFDELPAKLDREVGYIVHMPAEDKAEVVPIDIAAGWQAVEQIVFPVLEWRARKDLVQGGTVPGPPPPITARVEWCKAWIQAIVRAGNADTLAAQWPEGVPTPRQGGWTDADITRIAIVCSNVDARDGKPFWPPDPTSPKPTGKQHKQELSA